MEKWPFLDKNHGLSPWEKCQYLDVLNFSFFSLGRRFFVLEYRKRHFPGRNCLKKILAKWPFLDQNHGLSPWEKCQLLTFSTSRFYSLQRHFFVPEYRKIHFPGLYYLKKKVGKMAIFGPEAGVNPFGKMWIFRLFELLVFIA